MAIVRYEERVRVERDNGLRTKDNCVTNCSCTPYEDGEYAGKTLHDVANSPLRLNNVCPHPKMVVPVNPAFVVEDTVKVIKPTTAQGTYKLVDGNPCDGRLMGVLGSIPQAHTNPEIENATTVTTYTTRVEDTAFDYPNNINVVNQTIEVNGKAEQPVKTDEDTAKPDVFTDDGKTPFTEEEAEAVAGNA